MTGQGRRAPRELIGRSVGSYEIVELLGKGGMGAVYRARHSSIGRKAAIKVLHPIFAEEEAVVQRFFNEARAVNLVGHPSIVDIYDQGWAEGVGAYLVMEYLAGETLDRHLARVGRLAPAEVVQLVGRIAAPLAAAHAAGVVHRDLKPANIFLVPDVDRPGELRPKLLDFGIAKLLEGEAGAAVTRTGTLIGTPRYMSPEQCRGAKHVDHRTDIYALGIIAYEMLCGRTPFAATGYGEVLVKHLTSSPPSLVDQNVAIPEPIEAAVMQALAKRPSRRFQSVAAFAQALSGAALSGPGAARPLGATPTGDYPSTRIGGRAPTGDYPSTRIAGRAPTAAPGAEQLDDAHTAAVTKEDSPAAVRAAAATDPPPTAQVASAPGTAAGAARRASLAPRGLMVGLVVGLVVVIIGSVAVLVLALGGAAEPESDPLAELPPAIARPFHEHRDARVLEQALAFFKRHDGSHRSARAVLTAGTIAACRVKKAGVADVALRKLRGRYRSYAIRECRRAGISLR